MMQFDENTVPVYFGVDFTDGTDGTKVLDLSSTPDLAENAVIIEWGDYVETAGTLPEDPATLVSGTKARLVVPRGMLSERNAISLTKSDAQQLGVTMQALDANGSLGKVLMKSATGSVPSP
ncbi:hypothetical protein AN220_00660 [Streptomyces nanshensis]|nr:hypothetical protein AN220_00660 [Streptomyces nanshensis]